MSMLRMTVAALIVATATGLVGMSSAGASSAAPKILYGPHLCC